MSHYAIAEIDVTDPAWVADYIREVTPMIGRYGGRYLARSDKATRIEGDRPVAAVTVIIEWPDAESAQRFYQSEEYAPFLAARQAGAKTQFVLVPGEDLAGVV